MQADPSLILGLGRPSGKGIDYPLQYSWAFLMAQTVKNPPAMWETWFNPWVGRIPWRRAWQLTPVLLPGESPWTEELGGLQSMGSQRVEHYWATKHSTQHMIHVTFFVLPSLQDLSSSSRNWTQAMAVKAQNPNPWLGHQETPYVCFTLSPMDFLSSFKIISEIWGTFLLFKLFYFSTLL